MPEYLQILDNYSELPAIQEMGRGVEVSNFFLLHFNDLFLLSYLKLSSDMLVGEVFMRWLYFQAWLAKTIQKLDLHLLGICQAFKEENYITVRICFYLQWFYHLYFLIKCLSFPNFVFECHIKTKISGDWCICFNGGCQWHGWKDAEFLSSRSSLSDSCCS